MKLKHGLNLAYCTNIHRGENWAQTFETLKTCTMAVKAEVCPNDWYAIGLRLSDVASRELSDKQTLLEFQRWLDRNNSYVFTINGFPFGRFHGGRVKEQVYAPDWTSKERLDYTNRLFDLLAEMLPAGLEGSVSTLPGSFKEFIQNESQLAAVRSNLWDCVDHMCKLSERTGKIFHLGLEPEPLGLFENTSETIQWFQRFRKDRPGDDRWKKHLGLNYDSCHLAIEYEEPAEALAKLAENEIRISKFHFSSALKLHPTAAAMDALAKFADDVYLHQVIVKSSNGELKRYKDLDKILPFPQLINVSDEWRVHFHIPLHSPKTELFDNTTDHLKGLLDVLEQNPSVCSHIEMETYTWEVMPEQMKRKSVVEQLVEEYRWTLGELKTRGLY